MSIKIWWVVPGVVVLAWWAVQRRRQVAPVLVGAAVVGLVLDLPFLLMAPRQMFRMVVSDQLGRNEGGYTGLRRVAHLISVEQAFPHRSKRTLLVVVVLASLLGLAVLVTAWGRRRVRPLAVVLLLQAVVLIAAPSYFSFYSGYPAAALALVVAAAAASPRLRGVAVAGTAVAAAAALTLITVVLHQPVFTTPVHGADVLARGVAHTGCVMADSPMALIELNVLSRDLANGCPNWIDVTGRTYDVDSPLPGTRRGRKYNARWQRDLTQYLLSGDAAILFRPETGADASTVATIRSHPVLVSAGKLTVYRTRADPRRPRGGRPRGTGTGAP